MNHMLKKNLRARSKNKKLGDFEEHLEKRGIEANIDSLRQRIKKRRGIAELEGNQDKVAEKSSIEVGEANDEDRVGRKRKRSESSDEEMDDGETRKSHSKKTGASRSMTPLQLKIRSQSKVRAMSQSRREG